MKCSFKNVEPFYILDALHLADAPWVFATICKRRNILKH